MTSSMDYSSLFFVCADTGWTDTSRYTGLRVAQQVDRGSFRFHIAGFISSGFAWVWVSLTTTAHAKRAGTIHKESAVRLHDCGASDETRALQNQKIAAFGSLYRGLKPGRKLPKAAILAELKAFSIFENPQKG
ncbi:hypothetical protein ACS77_17445 [Pseudomonas syringae]|uniref:Uncharacterized protein n=1 Tax=Pseudomonas syringae TaxID=317 RepID=A0A0L1MCT5_PSESX|nr:hypothetical protein ACS77_17445 [Pseudomonas syringae]